MILQPRRLRRPFLFLGEPPASMQISQQLGGYTGAPIGRQPFRSLMRVLGSVQDAAGAGESCARSCTPWTPKSVCRCCKR